VLDHVVAADRPALSEAWRRAHDEGIATVEARVVGGGRARFDFLDVTADHGVFVVVATEQDGAELGTADLESHALIPRHCRVLRDESGRICAVDATAELVLGWTPGELMAELPLTLFHPDDHERLIDTWMATLSDPANGHRCRARFLRPDRTSWRWLEITSVVDDATGQVATEMLDISDEMEAHEAVRAREQLLHRLAEALPIGVLQLDRDRTIRYKNDHLGVLLGYVDATTAVEQLRAIHGDDQPHVLAALHEGLDHGRDRDVVARVDGDSERVVRIITKALDAGNGEVTGVIVSVTDITAETHANRDLERRATFDALTGCLNRPAILARLEGALRDAAHGAPSRGTAAIYLDLDGFKPINDRLGHAVGDDVLQLVADRLRLATRGHDGVGRLGGDEFLVVCHDVGELDALKVARRIIEDLADAPTVAGLDLPVRASVGVAWTADGAVGADELVARADLAMYRAKRSATSAPQLWSAAN
jgi:diguanylate cyclase (GGDEF)-like protein/PAS domain S-box-containing protein